MNHPDTKIIIDIVNLLEKISSRYIVRTKDIFTIIETKKILLKVIEKNEKSV